MKNPIIQEIIHILSYLEKVELCWIPGYSGIKGDEKADKFAKEHIFHKMYEIKTLFKRSGIFVLEAKEKYRGVFEIQKSGDKTSSGEIGLFFNCMKLTTLFSLLRLPWGRRGLSREYVLRIPSMS